MELISILMATDRISNYLNDSIKSILEQTYHNIELIFICNGQQSDSVYNYISTRFNDKRLKLYKTPIRQLAYSLNWGLSLANGNIVARMDSDDISSLNRLEIQYKFLKQNDLELLGCYLELIDNNGNAIGHRNYPSGKFISKNILVNNPFAHNTILCYKEILILNRGYLGGFNTEDYDMWIRLNKSNIRWDNISQYLVKYRIHDQSSQKTILSYAEASSLICREFILQPKFRTFIYFIISFIKPFFLAKKD